MADPERQALQTAAAQVGDRWTLLLIHALLAGPRRFGELQDEVDGISPNVLSQRLKQLETDALVVAVAYQQRPPRFAYELTVRGRELAGVLRLLAQWGAGPGEHVALQHEVCGTSVQAHWWCPTCEVTVHDEVTHLQHL